MFKKLLVPLDRSEFAEQAIGQAATFRGMASNGETSSSTSRQLQKSSSRAAAFTRRSLFQKETSWRRSASALSKWTQISSS